MHSLHDTQRSMGRWPVALLGVLWLACLPSAAAHETSLPPVIVAFGDSLTAGLGVPIEHSYPALLEQKLRAAGYPHRVINAGISGDTTAGGQRRVDAVLALRPSIVIVEFGANDGLRGIGLAQVRANLQLIIERLQKAGIHIVLAGMKLPPNYGPDYTEGFATLYAELARRNNVTLIPFFLDGVATKPELNQSDGLHPTAEGYRIIVDRIWPILHPLIDRHAHAP
jgi:acyl-CoA thioesterase-1